MSNNNDKAILVRDAAKRLGCPVSYVYGYLQKGLLKKGSLSKQGWKTVLVKSIEELGTKGVSPGEVVPGIPIKEASTRLGWTVEKVYRYLKTGRLRAGTTGTVLTVDSAQVEAIKAEQEILASSPVGAVVHSMMSEHLYKVKAAQKPLTERVEGFERKLKALVKRYDKWINEVYHSFRGEANALQPSYDKLQERLLFLERLLEEKTAAFRGEIVEYIDSSLPEEGEDSSLKERVAALEKHLSCLCGKTHEVKVNQPSLMSYNEWNEWASQKRKRQCNVSQILSGVACPQCGYELVIPNVLARDYDNHHAYRTHCSHCQMRGSLEVY